LVENFSAGAIMDLVENDRITWVTGDEREGPRQVIGVLEVHADGFCRAAFAERTQVDRPLPRAAGAPGVGRQGQPGDALVEPGAGP
jgi:hypothetical protein